MATKFTKTRYRIPTKAAPAKDKKRAARAKRPQDKTLLKMQKLVLRALIDDQESFISDIDQDALRDACNGIVFQKRSFDKRTIFQCVVFDKDGNGITHNYIAGENSKGKLYFREYRGQVIEYRGPDGSGIHCIIDSPKDSI